MYVSMVCPMVSRWLISLCLYVEVTAKTAAEWAVFLCVRKNRELDGRGPAWGLENRTQEVVWGLENRTSGIENRTWMVFWGCAPEACEHCTCEVVRGRSYLGA